MKHLVEWRRLRTLLAVLLLAGGSALSAQAQTDTPAPAAPSAQAPSATPKSDTTPKAQTKPETTPDAPTPATPPPASPPSASPPPSPPAPTTPAPPPPTQVTPGPPGTTPLAPAGKANPTEIEPNASPSTPQNATSETVDVSARPIVMFTGESSYDDAFKSIETSLETVKAAIDKAGLKPAGHPITIFSAPDDKGFKYEAAIPVAAKPDGKADLGNGVTFGMTPAGKAIKFQHRGAYEDIDSTYDVITAYLDAKGLQVDNPYIEEYLTDLTTAEDPNLQVDVYVFIK